jgi:Glycogen recognition site of AMP-activated protein kinase
MESHRQFLRKPWRSRTEFQARQQVPTYRRKTMKPPKIKLTPGRRPKSKSEDMSTSDTVAKSPASASQATSLPVTARPAGPLSTSRWNINEPIPTVCNLRKPSSPETAKESSRFQTAHFELFAPAAAAVSLAGSFNDWNPTATPMQRQNEGSWTKELMLPSGHYQYRFVMDGQWMEDPKAKDYVPNPYGGCNSVLHVE